ncbi:hypothetical protein ACQKCF_06335 [Psychrobacter proteolyticus]|uniref:hypothetical protein n=1 Tax=Psychrobacter proteolyticus TaxID=147825 RepID=UPI0013B390E3|nr:hypothetical protein [Psychrobacter proteolyticus]
MTSHKNLRKWFVLSTVAATLLLIPRRSSQKNKLDVASKRKIKVTDANGNDDKTIY